MRAVVLITHRSPKKFGHKTTVEIMKEGGELLSQRSFDHLPQKAPLSPLQSFYLRERKTFSILPLLNKKLYVFIIYIKKMRAYS